MNALPASRPRPRSFSSPKKRCSPVFAKWTQGSLGVRTDADTGMIYMRQRWYDPTLQRFISRDPIGLAGGANLYAYADGNPTKIVDPTGQQGEIIWEPGIDTIWYNSLVELLRKARPEVLFVQCQFLWNMCMAFVNSPRCNSFPDWQVWEAKAKCDQIKLDCEKGRLKRNQRFVLSDKMGAPPVPRPLPVPGRP
jgi:RHS repeat-associated protein